MLNIYKAQEEKIYNIKGDKRKIEITYKYTDDAKQEVCDGKMMKVRIVSSSSIKEKQSKKKYNKK